MRDSAVAGHSKFLLKRRIMRTKWGKIIAALVLSGLPGKSHVRQRSISGDSLFGYFYGDKSDWPSRGQERVYAMQGSSV
jgi:hypothetical protein